MASEAAGSRSIPASQSRLNSLRDAVADHNCPVKSPEELMIEDLRLRYEGVEISPRYLRLYRSEDPNGRMFADFQMRLNELFKFMNQKARSNSHYNANQSRELMSLIEEMRTAETDLRLVGITVSMKDSYRRCIDRCAEFLDESGGSTIPPDFDPVVVDEYEAVFSASGTEVHLPDRAASIHLKLVAEGAFAFVYRYDDPLYDIPFALKRAKMGLDKKDLIRFRNEFDLLKEIHHPNILQVFKFNDEKNEYSMEFCDATLRGFICQHNSRLPFGTRKRIALQFLFGLNHLHGRQHLHRDVSLQNVLVKTYDGGAVAVKVSDFGLLKGHDSTLTRTESELRGTIFDPTIESFKAYNILNEIYAIGWVLSFIFSGREQLGACTGEVQRIIDQCVNLTVGNRYPNVRSIIDEVERVVEPPVHV
jgi:hypothetical protein